MHEDLQSVSAMKLSSGEASTLTRGEAIEGPVDLGLLLGDLVPVLPTPNKIGSRFPRFSFFRSLSSVVQCLYCRGVSHDGLPILIPARIARGATGQWCGRWRICARYG